MSLLTSIGSLFAERGVQAVAAGLLSGVVSGTALVATGVIPVGGSPASAATVELLACPGSGPVLAAVADGQSLLVTARSADGSWLEVYVAEPGVERGWAPASALRLDTTASDLPIGACVGPSPAPLVSPVATLTAVATPSPEPSTEPSPAPSPSPTLAPTAAPSPSPTPKATAKPSTKPSPTSSPTPAASPSPTPFIDNTPPTLSNLVVTNPVANPEGKHLVFWPVSACTPHAFTVQVTATDPDDAVSGVTLYYQPSGGSLTAAAMAPAGGNTWQVTVNVQNSWNIGQIGFFAQGVDSHGNGSSAVYALNNLYNSNECFG